MPNLPEAYFDFVMDNVPYVYVVPEVGPDQTWGKAAFAAGFAVDFLFECYFDSQFDDRSSQIEAKIVDLADWLLTQQCIDPQRQACGGFRSTENSTYYYAVDACRVIPALLKAYELTSNTAYRDAAVLAGSTFLYNMQHAPSSLGVHDHYLGGFARAVTASDTWLPEVDVECLYGLVALRMLAEVDPANSARYNSMMADAADFLRVGLEGCFDHFSPEPSGDDCWHRVDAAEHVVYDDTLAYALLGLYDFEGWTPTVQKTYEFLGGISASRAYAAYIPAVCWAGYLDVANRLPECDYYDAVVAGILAAVRRDHDKSAYQLSAQIILGHSDQFMFWGVKHADFAAVENKQAMATVCWVGQFLMEYEMPSTRLTQVLGSKGETVTVYPVTAVGEKTVFGEDFPVKAVVLPSKSEETLLEPGYVATDYLVLHVFAPLRSHDKVRRGGVDYEIVGVQDFTFKGETAYRKATLRRLLTQ